MDPGGGGDPTLTPVLLQQRPEHLIDVLPFTANRAAENPFLDGAELPERRVAAAILKQHARLEPPRADRVEGKGSHQTDCFEEDTAASRRRRHGAFPLADFKRGIKPSNLNEADGRACRSGGYRVREGLAGRAFTQRA